MRFLRTPAAPAVEPCRPCRGGDLPWEEADDATWRQLALDLAAMERLGVYGGSDWSCSDAELYGACAYGFTAEQTFEVLRIGRKLRALPQIDLAFCEGWLTWRHVVVLTKVAVAKHEAAWLARALDLPLAELERLVDRSAEGWAPPTDDAETGVGGVALLGIAATAGRRTEVAAPRADRRRVGRPRVGPGRRGHADAAPNVRQGLRAVLSSA